MLLFASTVRLQDTFKGFRFEDNKSKYRWEDGKNGIPQLNHDSFLPPSMTVCMRGRMLYYRHGDYKYWFNVIINNRKTRIGSEPNDFALYQMPKGEFVVGSMTIVPSLDIVVLEISPRTKQPSS